MISRKMEWKYDSWLLLNLEKRCTSEKKYYEKKNATTKVFRMQKSAL